MSGYLIDTNHLSEAIKRVSRVRERIIRTACMQPVLTIIPVLCELEAGLQQTSDPDGYRRRLDLLCESLTLAPIDRESAQDYGRLFIRLVRLGRALSMTDMMLAAIAIRHDLVIVTSDRDFEALPEISTTDWIADAGGGESA